MSDRQWSRHSGSFSTRLTPHLPSSYSSSLLSNIHGFIATSTLSLPATPPSLFLLFLPFVRPCPWPHPLTTPPTLFLLLLPFVQYSWPHCHISIVSVCHPTYPLPFLPFLVSHLHHPPIVAQLDDLCIKILISGKIICLTIQITER